MYYEAWMCIMIHECVLWFMNIYYKVWIFIIQVEYLWNGRECNKPNHALHTDYLAALTFCPSELFPGDCRHTPTRQHWKTTIFLTQGEVKKNGSEMYKIWNIGSKYIRYCLSAMVIIMIVILLFPILSSAI